MQTQAHRRGFPSAIELAEIRQRLARGDNFNQVAEIFERKPETLDRYLRSAQAKKDYTITTRGGATISNLTFREVERLAQIL